MTDLSKYFGVTKIHLVGALILTVGAVVTVLAWWFVIANGNIAK